MRAFLLCALALPAVAQTTLTFEKDILPVVTQYCFTCHGQSSPQLGLDLRTAASTLRGSHNGPVIVKGIPEKSLLYQKISTKAMPPPAFKQTMPEPQIEIIKRWIAEGAPSDKPTGASKEVLVQRAAFDKEIMPLFTARCVQCHGAGKPMGGLDLRSLSALLKGSVNGAVVLEGFSEKKPSRSQSRQPEYAACRAPGEPLSEDQIQAIRKWIDKGQFVDHAESHESTRARVHKSRGAGYQRQRPRVLVFPQTGRRAGSAE